MDIIRLIIKLISYYFIALKSQFTQMTFFQFSAGIQPCRSVSDISASLQNNEHERRAWLNIFIWMMSQVFKVRGIARSGFVCSSPQSILQTLSSLFWFHTPQI